MLPKKIPDIVKIKASPLIRIMASVPVFLILLVSAIYLYLFSNTTLEKFLQDALQEQEFTVEAKVEKVSLFSSTIIKNIVLRTKGNSRPLLKIKEIVFDFSLADIWTGNLGINKLVIDRPQIYVEDINGKTNYETFVKKDLQKKPEEKEKESADQFTVQLPFSAKVYTHFELNQLRFTYRKEDQGVEDLIEISDFNLQYSFATKPFRELSGDPLQLVKILRTMQTEVRMPNLPRVDIQSQKLKIAGDHKIAFNLAYNSDSKSAPFETRFETGSENLTIRQKGVKAPFSYAVKLRSVYDPVIDKLKLHYLQVSLLDQTLLKLKGEVRKLQNTQKISYEFYTDRSEVNLRKLNQSLKSLPAMKKLSFSGFFSIENINLAGNQNIHELSTKLDLKQFRFTDGILKVSIPNFSTSLKAKINLLKKTAVEEAFLKLAGRINQGTVLFDTSYEQNRLAAITNIKNIQVKDFSPAIKSGVFNLSFNVKGPLSKLKGFLSQNISNLVYMSGRVRSQSQSLYIDTPVEASFEQKTSNMKFELPAFSMSLKNSDNLNAVSLLLNLNAKANQRSSKVALNIEELKVSLSQLANTMHRSQQASLQPLIALFPYPIITRLKSNYSALGSRATSSSELRVLLTENATDDLILSSTLNLDKKKIEIKKFKLTAFNEAINGFISGRVLQKKSAEPDLNFAFNINSEKNIEIFENSFLRGKLKLTGDLNTLALRTNVQINDLNFNQPGVLEVKNVNADIPIEHTLKLKKIIDMSNDLKNKNSQNMTPSDIFNFSIESVQFHMNPELGFVPLLSPKGEYPGLGMNLSYANNVFELKNLKANTLNGLVSSQNTYFNYADGQSANMAYYFNLQIKDIDLKNLMRPELANSVNDGIIRADMQLRGSNPDKFIENMAGYFSVYRIGEEFGKQALKVVQPDSSAVIDFAIDNSIIVKRIDMDIKEGLVYAKIVYKKGVLGNIIGPEGQQLVQERIPITEFMQRAEKEATVYQVKSQKE